MKERSSYSNQLEQRISKLEFKLKALQNFVFEHHHRMEHVYDSTTSKSKVWVEYPEGRKEEPLNSVKETQGEKV